MQLVATTQKQAANSDLNSS